MNTVGNHSYPTSPNYAIWHVRWDDNRNFARGVVATSYGYVQVYSEKGNHAHTSFRFICGGIEYYRGLPRSHKEKYLITLAKRYAEEISLKSKRQDLIKAQVN